VALCSNFESLVEELGLPEGTADRLGLLEDLVRTAPIALTSSRSRREEVGSHIADSLSALTLPVVKGAESIADIGSGGGFPGLVLAIALPRTPVTLLESVAKKASFLEDAAALLDLARVSVVAGRVEEWTGGAGTQSVVTARAVAPLGVLIEYAAPLLRVGGALVAWKGPASVGSELADATAAARELGMSPPVAAQMPQAAEDLRRLYVSLKVKPTPPGYPRAPGKARKRPFTA
jgi:16S rRNA (guanine527-N7)-methyltransferase